MPDIEWPYVIVLERLVLAVLIGLFIGLERERRGKESGVRTFALTAALGTLGGLMGENYALLSLLMLGVLITLINIQTILTKSEIELTTSIALLLTGIMGILCGVGHIFTPVAVGVITVALLAWKQDLSGFSINLTETELRSAILLGILAFVIYPALPVGSIDPWNVLDPREALVTVILIAGIGFINYILWKIYGARGIELTSFLAGLVNSSIAVSELSIRAKELRGQLNDIARRGIVLATAAMILRNGVLLALLAPLVFLQAALPFGLMFLACGIFFLFSRHPAKSEDTQSTPILHLQSPFSLPVAIRYGFIFLVLQVASVLAQDTLGQLGVYFTSFFGGLFSSSSAVAAAATLQTKGSIPTNVAAISAVIASATSVIVNLPLVARAQEPRLTRQVGWIMITVIAVGALGLFLQLSIFSFLN
ncbi:MAG TPA: DUF4010 domain-containing protein [Anaerolineales bacterium]|nr:DUF4010 domain-containing protein [Anaerolineales bacterium]